MMKAVAETVLASSSAHGLSRAAAAQSTPLKVAWILLFLFFVGLFCNTSLDLVRRLMDMSIVTTREDDKVPFQFPDLYFCPTDPISGSYPFNLNASEAAMVNDEVDRLSNLYDDYMATKDENIGEEFQNKVDMILQSMSLEVLKLLLHRPEQSVCFSKFCQCDQAIKHVKLAVVHESNICYKVTLSLARKQILESVMDTRMAFGLCLFTDPHNDHFKYSGNPVKSITNKAMNRTFPLKEWHENFHGHNLIRPIGYSLYLVPPGALPTIYEASVQLSPGMNYDIALQMDQVIYDQSLNERKCSPRHGSLSFVDPLTKRMVVHSVSRDGLWCEKFIHNFHARSNYTLRAYPVTWSLRGAPMWNNVGDMPRIKVSNYEVHNRTYFEAFYNMTYDRPCEYVQYGVPSFSFKKWPAFFGSFSRSFGDVSAYAGKPALEQLVKLGHKLDSGNHSAHEETVFQSYLSNSMLRVNIRAYKSMGARLLISYSYSWTQFLSDIGGLSGLYIGCSLVSFFELFELLYHLVKNAVWKRSEWSRGCGPEKLTALATDDPKNDTTTTIEL